MIWLFEKWAWLYNYNASGAIQVPNLDILGVYVTGPLASSVTQYYVVLVIVTLLTLLCINLTRGTLGRTWKATRDMDIAAELIGINLMKSKLTAFAVSSYIVGVAGALFVFQWRGAAEPNLFEIGLSFEVLFIAIIGGLGSILGNYLGAILIVGLPVVLNIVGEIELHDVSLAVWVIIALVLGGLFAAAVSLRSKGTMIGVAVVTLLLVGYAFAQSRGFELHSAMIEHLNIMIVGSLIVFFLIIEPHGLARLWALIREKLIIWPFPH